MLLRIGRWEIECDQEGTARCYSELPLGPECDCDDCRNFMAALDYAFPPRSAAFIASLGVDRRKPAELAHYGEESGLHITGGWFHLVGEIRSGADAWIPLGENSRSAAFEKLADEIEFGFTCQLALVRDPFKLHPVIQLEFATRVPWVIAAPKPECASP